MKKFLLFISLIAVADGWDNRSILIAQTSTDTASVAPGASAAAENENKPELLKTSPNGIFRVIQDSEEFWIVTAADEKQRTKDR